MSILRLLQAMLVYFDLKFVNYLNSRYSFKPILFMPILFRVLESQKYSQRSLSVLVSFNINARAIEI